MWVRTHVRACTHDSRGQCTLFFLQGTNLPCSITESLKTMESAERAGLAPRHMGSRDLPASTCSVLGLWVSISKLGLYQTQVLVNLLTAMSSQVPSTPLHVCVFASPFPVSFSSLCLSLLPLCLYLLCLSLCLCLSHHLSLSLCRLLLCSIAQAGFGFVILLSLPLKCRNCRLVTTPGYHHMIEY